MTKAEMLRNAASSLMEAQAQYDRERAGEQGGKRGPSGYPYEAWGHLSRCRMAVQHTLNDYDHDRICPCGTCKEIARKEAA